MYEKCEVFLRRCHINITALVTEFSDCDGNPCVNGGNCIGSGDGFVCNCESGYRGVYCEGTSMSRFRGNEHAHPCLHSHTPLNNNFHAFMKGKIIANRALRLNN